jgi:hypothetical protein
MPPAQLSLLIQILFLHHKGTDEEVRQLKLKKTKKDDMPFDKLGIYNVSTGVTDTIERLKSYKVPSKWSGWIAWQTEPGKARPAAPADSAAGKGEKAAVSAGEEKGEKPAATVVTAEEKGGNLKATAVTGQEKGDKPKKPKSLSADNGYTHYIRGSCRERQTV